jgi:hypothetical protein
MDHVRLAGALALVFWAAHVVPKYVLSEKQEGIFWLCHLGTLFVGIGGLAKMWFFNAVGLCWLSFGVICWAIDIASGEKARLSSVLSHVGGWTIGLVLAKIMGFPPYASAMAFILGVVVMRVTREVTPPASNINAAFEVHPAFRRVFHNHTVFIIVCAAMAAAIFAVTETILRHE